MLSSVQRKCISTSCWNWLWSGSTAARFAPWFEPSLAGIVEHWAQGIPWETLEASTNLDAGDLVRLIRRTLDLLSQIPYVPHLPAELRENARQAQKMLDRFPVSELI